ncbi:MAG: exonuclease SbcCD subunit D [Clostridia bacterium]|nr:exonuclease SbcCD subunit D [Clostridia bacterium]
MKFAHLSDLHLGKKVDEYSMIEDQAYILQQILQILDEERPDGVIIAGDVYDKSVPSAEAVTLFDAFLVDLAKRKLHVFVISGNHDSPERIAFGARLMQAGNVFLSPVYNGTVTPVTLEDAYGKIKVWMLPFVKPVHVRKAFPEEEIASYTDAVRVAVDHMPVDTGERNIMITHQFVTGAERSDSEETSIGGTDNVDASVFDVFDYTALGHIHRPQNCGSARVRYSGTPLKYSFSEVNDQKSVTFVELFEKGKIEVKTVDLKPKRDLVEIRGRYEEITLRDFYKDTTYPDDYLRITLTDEEDIPDAIGKLRSIYHNIMKLDYDNRRTRENNSIDAADVTVQKSPYEYFAELYEKQNNAPMNEAQQKWITEMIEKIWEENV